VPINIPDLDALTDTREILRRVRQDEVTILKPRRAMYLGAGSIRQCSCRYIEVIRPTRVDIAIMHISHIAATGKVRTGKDRRPEQPK
jgi:hypothetical protein